MQIEIKYCDLPNTLTQADVSDKYVLIKLIGVSADIMMQILLETCKTHIAMKNSKEALHAELFKSLYGSLKITELCLKVARDLEGLGF